MWWEDELNKRRVDPELRERIATDEEVRHLNLDPGWWMRDCQHKLTRSGQGALNRPGVKN